jgi:hypothetical protein
VIEAVRDFVVSVTDVAVRVTGLVGTDAGAEYFAVVASTTVTAPQAEVQAAAPWLRDQLTPLFVGSYCTVAVKVWTDFTGISRESGDSETAIAGTVIAAVPEAALVRDVAVMVAPRLLAGALAGALYVAEVLLRFVSVPAPDGGDIDQLTPVCAGSY